MGAVASNEREEHLDSTEDVSNTGSKVPDSAACFSSERNVSVGAPERERRRCGSAWRRWIRRFGVAGFAFFFIKGMLWLAIGAVLWLMRPGAAG